MVPWSNGRFLVWDATCIDTFCDSHKSTTAREAGGATALAESRKAKELCSFGSHLPGPACSFETRGTIGPESMSFLRNLSKHLRSVTGEPVHLLTCSSACLTPSKWATRPSCWDHSLPLTLTR